MPFTANHFSHISPYFTDILQPIKNECHLNIKNLM